MSNEDHEVTIGADQCEQCGEEIDDDDLDED